MSEHSYSRHWVHLIFQTKNHLPLITPASEPAIHAHITAQLTEAGCAVQTVNGTADHIHALFLLHPMRTITDVVKQVKGNTSHWINLNDLTEEKFSWEKGFVSFSLSNDDVHKTFIAIVSQKSIHESISVLEEIDTLITANGITDPGLLNFQNQAADQILD